MKQVKKTKQKSHSFVSAIIVTLLLLIGLSLLLYPTAADYINSLNYRQDIENYQRELFELDDSERQAMLEAAHSYNTALLDRSSRIGELDAAQRRAYESLLDPSGTGTHAILSGHTGLPSSKLFSNIDQLKIGDTFTMHILKETLTYKVESIERVAPDELKNLRIEQGQELCTLMTCTPYGINTNRLVVTGRRIETQAEPSQESTPVAGIVTFKWNWWFAFLPAILFAGIVIAVILIRKRKKVKKQLNARGRRCGMHILFVQRFYDSLQNRKYPSASC